MCKDCDNIKYGSTIKEQYCNKDQLKIFNNYSQCVEENTGKSEHELDLMEACTIIDCDIGKGVLKYAECSYQCHKDIVDEVVRSVGKSSTPSSTTKSSIPSSTSSEIQETGKSSKIAKSDASPNPNTKNSSMRLYNQFNTYSAILLIIISL
jgi:hypothetical protein